MCYTARPPRGTMLYALEIPDLLGLALGDTEFASAAEAWDALPEPIKQRIDGRRAVFDFSGRKRAFPPTRAEIDRFPPVRHPIVRAHPHTGRKRLYVMRHDCIGIEGIEAEEAEALIAALKDHIVKPAFIYRHQWRPGDLLIWDNCTVQHRAVQDYDLPRRIPMHRTPMGGAVPIKGYLTQRMVRGQADDRMSYFHRADRGSPWAGTRPRGGTVPQGIAGWPRSGAGRWRTRCP